MHPHAELISKGYEAFAAGDLAAIDSLLADDIAWTHCGDSPLAGKYRGKEEVFAYFGTLLEMTHGTFRQDIHAILADDDHVVVLTDVAWDEPHAFRGNDVFVWHVREGKAAACWAIPGEQAAATAALVPVA